MRILFIFLYVCTAVVLYGQVPHTLRITDMETGMPIEKVTVRIAGEQRSTDGNGLVQLPIALANDSVFFSHVRYESRSASYGQLLALQVFALRAKVIVLEEVAVQTGYQSINARLSTGAVDKIDVGQLQDIYGSSILQKLEGNSAIVFDKGGRSSMTIRGLSSINNSSLPLIVLDNFPFEGDIDLINPEDIADISVLKDAAAAAIWGTRAGNGVVIITTKKGRYDMPTRIAVTTGTQVQQKPDLYGLNRISSSGVVDLERLLFEKGYYTNQEKSTSKIWLSPVVEHLIAIRDGIGNATEHEAAIEGLRYNDVRNDYERYVYRNAVNRNYNLNLEGGNTNLRYLLSGRFDDNVGNLHGRDKKTVLRSFLEFRLLPKLNFSSDLQYYRLENEAGRTGYTTTGTRPYMMLADADGNALPHARYRTGYLDSVGEGKLLDWYDYPLTDYQNREIRTVTNMLTANLSADYKILDFLNLQGNYRYERSSVDNSSLYGEQSYFVRDLINTYSRINAATGAVSYGIPRGGIMDQERSDGEGHNLRLGAEFQKNWNDLRVTALLGTEWRQLETIATTDRRYGFDPDNYTVSLVDYVNAYNSLINNTAIYVPFKDSRSKYVNRYISQYMNVSASYRDRYVLTGSVRRDASNLFGVKTNERWQPLWSLGYRWNISEEEFVRLDWLSRLSLRLSYGVTGNVDQSRSAVTTIKYLGPDTYTNSTTAAILQYANPELRWEKSRITNIGFDFSVLNGALGGSVDYYGKRGEDLFGTAPIDFTAVPSKSVMRNVASMKGRGLDVSLHADIKLGKAMAFRPQFMLNTNSSEITDYYLSGSAAYEFISHGTSVSGIVGNPVYAVMAYPWMGLDEAGNPMGILNGEQSVDYAGIRNQDKGGLEYKGSAVPLYTGFFNPVFAVGRFELGFGFSFKFGHVFRRESVRYGDLVSMGALGAGSGDYDRRWQQAGDEVLTSVPSFVYPVVGYRNHFYENSSVLVESGDHIRFQNMTVAYGFELRSGIKGRLNLNGTNLGLLWRKNRYGIDPDYVNQLAPGRLFSVGLRFNY
ncbi:SusC/RagA family TonB-linked outer membrane protein [Sphingobacterium sp. LRF_L2]|uniref:SusC/RagA family TonB-linked outer membrane protein n=1 Tax=Sphingobacterium sp. LRF_L2 TaxID=3369421 RepID=UPI003F632B89